MQFSKITQFTFTLLHAEINNFNTKSSEYYKTSNVSQKISILIY